MAADNSLVVLWTSGDPEVAENMVFMYTINAKKQGWWQEVKFIIWGPSSKLLSENQELQEQIKDFIEAGIKVEACKACADRYNVAADLAELGIEVKYMGEPLTDYLKSESKVMTF
ncbi:MAG: DsrE family protein [Halanaerobiales bacterium]|nr:DsrE family protein [Halanaerobiales bacterium]